jgi:Zn-dependent M28 family amino/carboxypeptidase
MKSEISRLKEIVNYLATITPPRNYRQPASLETAASFIEKDLREYGYLPWRQKWTAEGGEYANLVAQYNAGKEKTLIVGAHYDVCGYQPGADDNASGVAGLLELARMLSESKIGLPYTIELVAYCLEEPPFFATQFMGSYIHAASLQERKVNATGMICLEMIGYFTNQPQPYPADWMKKVYPPKGDFIVVVGIEDHASFNNRIFELMRKDSEVDVQVINFNRHEALAGLSDHRNYWDLNIPALMINDTSFVRNSNYHQMSDAPDTLDYHKMAQVVDSLFRAVVKL